MEGEDASSAAEAALGLSPQIFVNEVHNIIADLRYECFKEYCLQEGTVDAVGAATATNKAEELQQGVQYMHNLVQDVLDKRMGNWEKYCLRHCLTVPEEFVAPEDDNSSAKVSHKDGNYDTELDAELNILRTKLGNANKESEELQRELSSLERQATYKTNLKSSIAEVLKVFEDKSVQDNMQALVNILPKLRQKMKVMKRKKLEFESMVGLSFLDANGIRNQKRLASCSNVSTEDIQEVNQALDRLRKE